MPLTNKQNLPAPLVEAIKADDYDRGEADISVTQLIDPPQLVWLVEQHKDEIEEDAADCIYRLLGKTVHKILEESESLMPVEKRLFVKCGGWTISGGMDRIALQKKDLGIDVQDWKVTTAWSIALEKGVKQEWVNQLNCYAWLLRQNGYDPQKLTVVAILRDWSKLEAKRNSSYPQHQVMVIDVPMWSARDAEAHVSFRVRCHQQHRDKYSDLSPIPCTPAERWERPTRYAVMKEGRKSALRVLDSLEDALDWKHTNGAGKGEMSIVERPGEAVRCENYCAAAPWCPQYQQEKEASC